MRKSLALVLSTALAVGAVGLAPGFALAVPEAVEGAGAAEAQETPLVSLETSEDEGEGVSPDPDEGNVGADDESTDGELTDVETDEEGEVEYEGTGWRDAEGAETDYLNAVCWVDDGVVATSKFFYDPSSDAWFWAEDDGTIARGKDAYVPWDNLVDRSLWLTDDAYRRDNGKWVRLDDDGMMVKGESYLEGEWYLFDQDTGAMQYGFVNVPTEDGGKWVFYDYVTGQMAHGERYIDDSHGDEAGWMYFDPYTGAVDYEWAYLPESDKWVYYDPVTGRMWYGSVMIDGTPHYLDSNTGERISKDEMVARLISIARGEDGTTSGDKYVGALASVGGMTDPMGPCMTYVWWCFQQAGFHYQLLDGEFDTGYPHHVADWYSSHGRLFFDPQPGDIWLVNQPTHGWQYIGRVSATHAGIIESVEYNLDGSVRYVYVWQHVRGWVQLVRETPDNIDGGWVTGYARPNYND